MARSAGKNPQRSEAKATCKDASGITPAGGAIYWFAVGNDSNLGHLMDTGAVKGADLHFRSLTQKRPLSFTDGCVNFAAMKCLTSLLVGAALAAFTVSAQADSTVTISGVHNCCKGCANGIDAAVTKAGATSEIDDTTVKVTAKTEADARKAVAALVAAGYFGDGATAPEVTDAKVKSATVSGVHLCCGKCVKAVDKAVKAVAGASSHTAEKGADSFSVEGDFSTAELAAALNKQGLSGAIK